MSFGNDFGFVATFVCPCICMSPAGCSGFAFLLLNDGGAVGTAFLSCALTACSSEHAFLVW